MTEIEDRQYQQYQEGTDRLADRVGTTLTALWAAHESGQIDPDAFQGLAITTVMAGKTVAARNADVALSAALTAVRGTDVPPAGAGLPTGTEQRLSKALATLTDDTDEPAARLQRLGRSETWESGADTWQDGLQRHGVEKWTRRTSGKSCPACVSLADGTELLVTTPLWRHPGCDCLAQPTT